MRVVLALVVGLAVPAGAAELRTVGWLESIEFPDAKVRVVAKLDTGAKTSSLDARDVKLFHRDGGQWARFGLHPKDGKRDHVMEARVVGTVHVRSAEGKDERPLVELWVCFAGERRRVEFSLGRRAGMNYRVILGRRALEGRMLVDSARKFTTTPDCPKE